MTSNICKNELKHLLEMGVHSALRGIDSGKYEDVFALAIYTSSGFSGTSVAFCTRKHLEENLRRDAEKDPKFRWKHRDAPAIFASEWDDTIGDFGEFNDKFYEFYDSCEDSDTDDESDEVPRFFFDSAAEILDKLKRGGSFDKAPFEKDVFLSVQFSDYGPEEFDRIEGVSKKLNSDIWQARLKSVFDRFRVR